MTVFRAFLRVLNKGKATIILYTIILIFFGIFNMQTSENSTNFVASKPDILIINQDKEEGITKNLMDYLKENSQIVEIKEEEQAIDDALFYRDVNYIVYIPKNYRQDFLAGKNPEIQIKSTGDYQASFAQMMLERYIKVANSYQNNIKEETQLIQKINETLAKQTEVEITSQLDTDHLSKATFYYNFANYSLLAGCVFVICLVLASFKDYKITKRTMVSSMSYQEFNRKLLLSNCLFAVVLWIFYGLLSLVLIGEVMFSIHGLIYLVNSFVFTLCAVTIAFLIGNLIQNKNAINGIVNVVALGSCFLCGAFVPMDWLPDYVLKIAHILPSYYYIKNNEWIKELETINYETLKPIFQNLIIILLFASLFVFMTNMISKRKQKT
ncbi:MAG: ABC transporter permease [Clostridia bacterium]|nr:ABC transporter permease [Clostridia bacterium]